jgi:hypothetical protein
MAKESLAVGRAEGGEALGQGRLEISQVACGGLAQMSLEFGEGHFDRIEIWAVRRQVTHARSLGRDQRRDGGDFVGGKVIEDDDIARAQFRAEHLLKISGEDLGVDRAFDQKGRRDAFDPQGGNEGGTLPMTMRHAAHTALASPAPPVEPGQLGVQARFINEDQALTVPARLSPAPIDPRGLDVRPLLLGGVRRFFYSSNPTGRAGATGR